VEIESKEVPSDRAPKRDDRTAAPVSINALDPENNLERGKKKHNIYARLLKNPAVRKGHAKRVFA